MDYYLFVIIVILSAFGSAVLAILRHRSLWIVGGGPIVVALIAFGILKMTSWIGSPSSSVTSIGDAGDLSGAQEAEYIVMWVLGILTQIALGNLLQKYKGLRLLETVGFNMLVSAVVGSLIVGASV